jgi:hypothetical protein
VPEARGPLFHGAFRRWPSGFSLEPKTPQLEAQD